MIAPRTIRHFPLGQILATTAALDAMNAASLSPVCFLIRHLRNDWGDIGLDDWRLNNEAAEKGGRIFSSYSVPSGTRIWVITEADRQATTILTPEDY